tara:strand:- start:38181 stop:38924 length:744 start_codon:yes stop_codon:yes gene_type:complete
MLTLCSTPLFAQKEFQFHVGPSFFYAKDEIVAQSVFTGSALSISTSFGIVKPHHITRFQTGFTAGDLYSKSGDQWIVRAPSAQFSHLRSLTSGRVNHYIGLGIDLQSLFIDSQFRTLPTFYDGRKSGFLDINFSLLYDLRYKISSSIDFFGAVELPVISYLFRPGYAVFDPDELIGKDDSFANVIRSGSWTNGIESPSFTTNIGVQEHIRNGLSVVINYQYQYNLNGNFKRYLGLRQSISVGVKRSW